MSKLHKIFVYGTLKLGEPNHHWLYKNKGTHQKFLYLAKTVEKFPLIIGSKYNIPFLLDNPGNGFHVKGEIYETDDAVISDLDALEGHPNYYIRELYDFKPLDTNTKEPIKAWVYVLKNYKKELMNETFYENYSSSGDHGRQYVHAEHRDKNYNLRAATLANYPEQLK